MIGAIIGDIVGSRFEWNNTHSTDFELFTDACDYTDDTICTIAVAEAIVKNASFGKMLHRWCRAYPHPMGAYGGRFAQWVNSRTPQPYGSFGNGSAMRVSPCGWLDTLEDVKRAAELSALPTHNHSEGIKGAVCVADLIWQARQGATPTQLTKIAHNDYGYSINTDVDTIRVNNRFDETCQVTVPQAIVCATSASSFEEAIRLAVSIGGDSDTIAAIAGSIVEPIFGIPQHLQDKAISYLPAKMQNVLAQFKQHHG